MEAVNVARDVQFGTRRTLLEIVDVEEIQPRNERS